MELIATVLLVMSSAFIFVYFQAEPWTLVKVLVKIILLLACITFLIQIIGKKLWNLFSKHRSKPNKTEHNRTVYIREQYTNREKLQKDFETKAENYKEKILLPREEAKKKHKEEEYYRFLGAAWKGKGEELGEEMNSSDDTICHQLQDSINEEMLEQVIQDRQREARKKQRKKVVLPEEPDQNHPDSLQIILRSPLGQIHTRRFLYSDTLQVILDYITTLGFNQTRYTVCTTYPRNSLSEQREETLSELQFTKRTTLNIEEKEY